MMDDTLAMDEDEEIEEEADAEVDKVLFDLTNGKLGQAGTVQKELPVCAISTAETAWSNLAHSRRKTGWKTKRRKESWSSTGNSSAACSADRSLVRSMLLSMYHATRN